MKATRKSPSERFWSFVESPAGTDCWLWTGSKDADGYGLFAVQRDNRRRSYRAHRWSYEYMVDEIPDGLQLDHLCRVRNCVNPAHLDPVTPWVNVMRGETLAAENVTRTHCPRGHLLVDTARPGLMRRCRECSNSQSRIYKGWDEAEAWSAPIAVAPAKRTECPRGHDYTPENTRVDKGGKRHCRICSREMQRERRRAARHNSREKD